AFAQHCLLPAGWLREIYIKWYNTPPLSPWDRPGKRGNMKRELLWLAMLVCFCVPLLAQQVQITKLEINTVPADRRVRAFENVAVQVLIFADVTDKDGKKKNGRIRQNGAKFRIKEKDGGWLSKPFLFQGDDKLPVMSEGDARLAELLG